MCEEGPCGCAGNGGLEILREAPTSAEPCEVSFYHPTSRQEFEAAGGVGALDPTRTVGFINTGDINDLFPLVRVLYQILLIRTHVPIRAGRWT